MRLKNLFEEIKHGDWGITYSKDIQIGKFISIDGWGISKDEAVRNLIYNIIIKFQELQNEAEEYMLSLHNMIVLRNIESIIDIKDE